MNLSERAGRNTEGAVTMFDLEKSAVSYLNAVRASGCSADTLENYARILRLYAAFVKENDISGISPADISDYKVSLAARGLKQSTIRAYMEAISLFFAWCVDTRLLSETPCVSMVIKTKVPPPKRYAHLLDTEDVEKILRPVCPKGATRSTWTRTYAMVVLFLTGSMRNSELRALTPADLDYASGVLHIVSGKGDKERWCSFPPVAQEAVKAYLVSGLRPKFCAESDFLFGKGNTQEEWHPFDRSELSAVIERYVRLVTGKSDIRTHALRHSSASILFDAGMDLADISDLLGHSSPEVTKKIYVDRLDPARHVRDASGIFSALSEAV